MAFLERMKVVHRIVILAALTLAGILMIIWESASSADEVLMDDRLLKTRHVVEVAHGVIKHWHEMETSGQMNRADAQKQALLILKGLRYEDKEYFWVNDMHPKMVMHPFKPELDGKDLSDFKDPDGKKLFVEFVDTVKKSGGGFVNYLWPKPGEQDPVAKVSYVKGYAPWGWVIGSGVYIDDLDNLFWMHTTHSMMLAAVLTVVLVVAAWLIGRSITRQLGAEPTYAMGIADKVAAGDLTTQIRLREGDSHSVLHALKVMQDGLTGIISRIQGGTREIAQAADRLVSISESIRQASTHQAEAASSTASAVNQISTSIGHVSDSANETEQNSVKTSELSKSGEKLAQEASQGIAAIAATVDVATKQIQSLKGRMSEISTFSKVIKEIADQTNLLALNAAIEAARAGEQGRGFAVVADEVRKLAERASNATSQIAEVIRAVEGETQTTVGSIEAIVPQVGRGVQLSGEAAKSLNQINLGAGQTLSRVREVAHAMGELRQAADSISSNVEQIADMVEKNSAAIHSSSESSRNLRSLSGQLQEAVSRFRTAA